MIRFPGAAAPLFSAALAAAALALVSACASLPDARLERDLRQDLPEQIAPDFRWRRDARDDALALARANELAADGLTADDAVLIALLRNPDLQQRLEELGVARAEYLDATRLPNPVLTTSDRRLRGGAGSNVEFALAQDLLAVFTLPGRSRAASRTLTAARLAAAGAVLRLAADARADYLRYVAARRQHAFRSEHADIAQIAFELAERYHSAGNFSVIEAERERDAALTARVSLGESGVQLLRAREALARRLGIDLAPDVSIDETLPAPPVADPALAALEASALEHRFDVRAAKLETEALVVRRIGAHRWRALAALELGVSTEKDPDGARVTGPTLALPLPLFSAGAAAVAMADARSRAALRRAESLALEARAELRVAHAELANARQVAAHYRDQVIPAREKIVDGEQREFAFMLKGPFDPLRARQELLLAREAETTALANYWIARIELERAAGQPLPAERGESP